MRGVAHGRRAFSHEAIFRSELNQLKSAGFYREFRYLERVAGQHPKIRVNGEWVTNWCSNDYLNMGHDPRVLGAMHEALDSYGAGAGGTRNISGSLELHRSLEDELAQWTGQQAGLLFPSCYTANLGVFEALARVLPVEDTMVFSDEENHASVVQGIRASRMRKQVIPHNDVAAMEEALCNSDAKHKVVVIESLYSMSGSVSDVRAVAKLCREHDAISVLDEVHALGLYGEHGGGILERESMLGEFSFVTGTLAKAVGVSGGFVSASSTLIDCVRSFAPSFIFTTSMSPVAIAGVHESLKQLRGDHGKELRSTLRQNVALLRSKLSAAGIRHEGEGSHIIKIPLGDSGTCSVVCAHMFEQDCIYCQPIAYPSVPRNHAMIRITCSPRHTEEDMDHLVESLARARSMCQQGSE